MIHLDQLTARAENDCVLFNSGTGNASPNTLADTRHLGGFFMSVSRHTCAFSMAGRGEGSLRAVGSNVPILQTPCHVPATSNASGEQASNHIGAIMLRIITRALSRLFPISTRRLAFAMYRRNAIRAVTLVRLIGGAA